MSDQVDQDRNGVLTPDELYPVVVDLSKEHPYSITLEHCHRFVQVWDEDGNGVITRDEMFEFCKFMFIYEVLANDSALRQEMLALQDLEDGEIRAHEGIDQMRENKLLILRMED